MFYRKLEAATPDNSAMLHRQPTDPTVVPEDTPKPYKSIATVSRTLNDTPIIEKNMRNQILIKPYEKYSLPCTKFKKFGEFQWFEDGQAISIKKVSVFILFFLKNNLLR